MAEKFESSEKVEEKGAAPDGGAPFVCCAYVTVLFAVVMKGYNKYNIIVLFYDKELLWEKH